MKSSQRKAMFARLKGYFSAKERIKRTESKFAEEEKKYREESRLLGKTLSIAEKRAKIQKRLRDREEALSRLKHETEEMKRQRFAYEHPHLVNAAGQLKAEAKWAAETTKKGAAWTAERAKIGAAQLAEEERKAAPKQWKALKKIWKKLG